MDLIFPLIYQLISRCDATNSVLFNCLSLSSLPTIQINRLKYPQIFDSTGRTKNRMDSPKKPAKETSDFPFTWNVAKKSIQEAVQWTKKLVLKNIGQRSGDVVVLTGGARGIGAEITKKLLQCDFHIVMGLRNIPAGEKLVAGFREEGITTGRVTYLPLDLKSLASVREFGNALLEKFPKIHILICNAGIMFTPYELTEDGFESQFQVDYLGHFLLTRMLLPRMIETAHESPLAGRIVNVSSAANWAGQIKNISDIETRAKEYNPFKTYCDAKLAQVASSNYLDKLLRDQKTNVYVYSLHPGAIPTELGAHVMNPPNFIKKFMRTTEDGADVVVCAAASPEFEKNGGIFLMNCKKERPNEEALNEKLQENLWDKSCDLLGIESTI